LFQEIETQTNGGREKDRETLPFTEQRREGDPSPPVREKREGVEHSFIVLWEGKVPLIV